MHAISLFLVLFYQKWWTACLQCVCYSLFLTNFQNNVNVANQQTSIGSMLDYSQGFSATYFEVINLLDSLLLISLVYTSLEVRTILYSCREDHHSKENTLVSYNQEMSFKAKSKFLLICTGRKHNSNFWLWLWSYLFIYLHSLFGRWYGGKGMGIRWRYMSFAMDGESWCWWNLVLKGTLYLSLLFSC